MLLKIISPSESTWLLAMPINLDKKLDLPVPDFPVIAWIPTGIVRLSILTNVLPFTLTEKLLKEMREIQRLDMYC